MTLRTSSTTEFLTSYEGALDWIKQLGVEPNKNSRVNTYRKSIETFINVFIRKTTQVSEQEKQRIGSGLVNAFQEAHELVYVHGAFRGAPTPGIEERLKKVVDGPISYTEEKSTSSSNVGRNIGFELYIAAIVKNSGYSLDLSTITDLAFKVESTQFYLECKRPENISGIESNIKKANRQLKKRFSNSDAIPNKKGLLGISFTRLFNPKGLIFQFENESHMHEMLQKEAAKMYATCKDIVGKLVDRRVLGWIGQISVPVIVLNKIADVSMYNYPIFVNITNENEADHEFMNIIGRNIMETFQNTRQD